MLFLPREEGQGLVEYALILIFVALAVIVLLTLLGSTLASAFSRVVSALS